MKGQIEIDYIKKPLTAEEIRAKNYNLCEVIGVTIGDLVDHDFEGVLDMLSEKLTGTICF